MIIAVIAAIVGLGVFSLACVILGAAFFFVGGVKNAESQRRAADRMKLEAMAREIQQIQVRKEELIVPDDMPAPDIDAAVDVPPEVVPPLAPPDSENLKRDIPRPE